MRPMRRASKQVDDRAILVRWLEEASVGRLATIDEDGYPVVKAVNYVYAEGKIFFHCGPEGEKIDDIRRDNKVCFEVDKELTIIPPIELGCETHSFYQSIIIRGRARILDQVEDEALKERALRDHVKKYAPGFENTPLSDLDKIAIVEITIEQMSGKEDLGQKWPPEKKLAIARKLLERDGEAARDIIAKMGLAMEQVADVG